MTNRFDRRTHPPLLRWVFQRGDEQLLCQVHVQGAHSVTLSIMSVGGIARTAVEKFDDALQAFQRHARIAVELREFGWTLASYGR